MQAALAGLENVGLVAEPVAAARYVAAVLGRRLPVNGHLVVYDLGAGTFDVSVNPPWPGGFDVVGKDGLADVGDLDLDAVVVRHAHVPTAWPRPDAWEQLDWPRDPADHQARHTLWQGARGQGVALPDAAEVVHADELDLVGGGGAATWPSVFGLSGVQLVQPVPPTVV